MAEKDVRPLSTVGLNPFFAQNIRDRDHMASKINKLSFKEWELAIREAKAYVNNYGKVRWKIVDIALRVCDTAKGGRKVAGIFSIKKFATEIDLNPKTLYEWIKVKKFVVDKLPATELKDKTKYQFNDLRDVAYKLRHDSSKREVLDAFRLQLGIPLENKKFMKYEKHLNTLLYNAQRPMQLMLVDIDIIKTLQSKARLISDFLCKEVELRERLTNSQRVKGEKTRIVKAVDEARKL